MTVNPDKFAQSSVGLLHQNSGHDPTKSRHLEKQNELLMDAYRSMSHELHKLQVEEEMLMRKYYEFMAAQDLVGKKTSEETIEAGALVVANREEQS